MDHRPLIKAAVVAGLTLLLLIPLALIRGVIHERGAYRQQAAAEVARTGSGSQLLLGPVLSVPYEFEETQRLFDHDSQQYEIETTTHRETLHLVVDALRIDGDIAIEKRWRGIYSVPVYTATLVLDGRFVTAALAERQASIDRFARWLPPTLSLVVSDVRGIASHPRLTWDGREVEFAPGSVVPTQTQGLHAPLPALPDGGAVDFSVVLELRGSQALHLAALADDVSATLRSPWPHPKFDGRFLPRQRAVSDAGFEASWRTSAFSTGAAEKLDECIRGQCAPLLVTSFGVQFIETADIYQKITRATKYGLLFIVLTFVAFALTEALSGARLHPVQYALVGLALAIFYLLLIALSEHLRFAQSFSIAAVACVALIAVYVAGALDSIRHGLAYGSGIGLLYAMLYAILRSEDFALLMGTLLLFAMLAAVMLLTRRYDWHRLPGSGRDPGREQT